MYLSLKYIKPTKDDSKEIRKKQTIAFENFPMLKFSDFDNTAKKNTERKNRRKNNVKKEMCLPAILKVRMGDTTKNPERNENK